MNLPEIAIGPSLAKILRDAAAATVVDDASLSELENQLAIAETMDLQSGGGIAQIIGKVEACLERPPWAVLIRGLPTASAMEIIVAVSARLGTIEEPFRTSWSRFVREIVPSRDKMFSGRLLNEYLHTDGSDWPRPNDFTCLFCVAPDSRGGKSRLTHVDAVINAIKSSQEAESMLSIATASLPWLLSDAFEGKIHWDPILNMEKQTLRWMRYTVCATAEVNNTLVSPKLLSSLYEFERLVEGIEEDSLFNLEAGDLLIFDNTRCLHARTPVADTTRSKRKLLRTKVVRRLQCI